MLSGLGEIVRMAPETARARGLMPSIERIFFDSAARGYEPGPERDAFHERWLGRYLGGEDCLLVGLAPDRSVWGYLVGTLDNAAESARFADLAYFRDHFVAACRKFPAHLHINLDAAYRNRGLGALLVEEFALFARAGGCTGLHVVTGAGMRNVRFYKKCGFGEVARATSNGRELLFLGRKI